MYKRALIVLFLTVFLLGFVLILCPMNFVFADDPGDTDVPPGDIEISGELPNFLKSETFEDLIKGISLFLYAIAAPLGVIMILYSAFLFMTSGGNEERVKKAKKTLLWTIVGITIIIIGYGFVTLIKDILSGV